MLLTAAIQLTPEMFIKPMANALAVLLPVLIPFFVIWLIFRLISNKLADRRKKR